MTTSSDKTDIHQGPMDPIVEPTVSVERTPIAEVKLLWIDKGEELLDMNAECEIVDLTTTLAYEMTHNILAISQEMGQRNEEDVLLPKEVEETQEEVSEYPVDTIEHLIIAEHSKVGKVERKKLNSIYRRNLAMARSQRSAVKVANHLKRQKFIGHLDETHTKATGVDNRDWIGHGDERQLREYSKARELEVVALYNHLGCEPVVNEVNCFGSYAEVARLAKTRIAEWKTTKVTAWLKSRQVPLQEWGANEEPYTSILPYLPDAPQTVLDYGVGSGKGLNQVVNYLNLKPKQVTCWDIEDNLDTKLRENYSIAENLEQYDLTLLVNVLHHVQSGAELLQNAMSTVKLGGTLLIKDHFVSTTSILLATLLHEMYADKNENGSEQLYFRDLNELIAYIRLQGWSVETNPIRGTDVGDRVLICVNLRDGGQSQFVKMATQIDQLTKEVLELKQLVTMRFSSPVPDHQAMRIRAKEKANRYKDEVKRVTSKHDLEAPKLNRKPQTMKKGVKYSRTDFEPNRVIGKGEEMDLSELASADDREPKENMRTRIPRKGNGRNVMMREREVQTVTTVTTTQVTDANKYGQKKQELPKKWVMKSMNVRDPND
jgi:SAM-dependent methyltransferase